MLLADWLPSLTDGLVSLADWLADLPFLLTDWLVSLADWLADLPSRRLIGQFRWLTLIGQFRWLVGWLLGQFAGGLVNFAG